MRLHLRQVEVRSRAALDQLLRVVEEEQREVEDRAGDGLAVDLHVLLDEVPAARARDQHRGLVVQLVLLAALLERDRAADRVAQVELALDHVRPGRAVRVLEVRHEGRRAAVERVDHHLAVGRAGDLDAAVEEVRRLVRDLPLRLADRLRLGEEIGQPAGVEVLLPRLAAGEELLPAAFELAMQLRDERERFRGQDGGVVGRDRAGDLDAGGQRGCRSGCIHWSVLGGTC